MAGTEYAGVDEQKPVEKAAKEKTNKDIGLEETPELEEMAVTEVSKEDIDREGNLKKKD